MIKAFKILFLALFALVSTQSAGQQQLFLNQTGGAPPTAGLLDQYKGAAFAAAPDVLLYSTYSATDDIAGSLTNGQVGQWSVAVFRDFDDAIKSFTPAEVADGTANTWVQELGPSDGFVRRWYDQSVTVLDVSNLNHADQENKPNMPKLFDSATGLILENGKAALDFDGINDFLIHNTMPFVQGEFAIFSCARLEIPTGLGNGIFDASNNIAFGAANGFRLDNYNGSLRLGSNKSFTIFSNTITALRIYSGVINSTTRKLYVNNTNVSTTSGDNRVNWTNVTQFKLGAMTNGSSQSDGIFFLPGKISTLTAYNADQESNMSAIISIINTAYNNIY